MFRLSKFFMLMIALCGAAALSACGGDDDNADTRCGPGTELSNGQCVPIGSVICADGTLFQNGECVPGKSFFCPEGTLARYSNPGNDDNSGRFDFSNDLDIDCVAPEDYCEAGTVFDQTLQRCMAEGEIRCGPGTVEQDGGCVLASTICGPGTVDQNGQCVLESDACGPNAELDSASGQCVLTDSFKQQVCGDQATFDEMTGRCMFDGNSGESFCGPNTMWSAEVGACVRGVVFTGDCASPMELTENITQDTIFSQDSCFYVPSGIAIAQDILLTIEEGVTLVFAENAFLDVNEGRLKTLGTSENPVTLTAEDQIRGSWRGVRFRNTLSDDNVLEHTIIEYGGRDGWDEGSANVVVSDIFGSRVRLRMRNVTLRESSSYGFFTELADIPEFLNNTLTSNTLGAAETASDLMGLFDATSTFVGNNEDLLRVRAGAVTTAQTWDSIGIPFVIEGDLNVTAAVEVNPGATIQFEENASLEIEEEGSMSAVGTADMPIVFEGREDIVGYWYGIQFYNTQENENRLEYVTVSHGGRGAWDGAGGIKANVTLNDRFGNSLKFKVENSTFDRGGGYGLYISNGAQIEAFSTNTFTSNSEGALYVEPDKLGDLDAMSTYTGNDIDIVVTPAGTVSTDQTWEALGVPVQVWGDLVVSSNVTINPGAVFEFEENMMLQVNAGTLNAVGTAAEKIEFRGVNPITNYWGGIGFYNTLSVRNELSHVVIRHGGGGSAWLTVPPSALRLSTRFGTASRLAVSELLIEDASSGVIIGNGFEIPACTNVSFVDVTTDVSGPGASTWTQACM